MTELRFTTYGRPQQRGSKRPFKAGDKILMVDDNSKSKPWMAAVSHAAGEAMDGAELMMGPLVVWAAFYFKRPQSHYRGGKFSNLLREDAPVWAMNVPDGDKLFRALGDALTGVVYRDDKQICDHRAIRIHTEAQERAIVIIRQVEKGEAWRAMNEIGGVLTRSELLPSE